MKIAKKSIKGDKLVMEFKEADAWYTNALRRLCMEDVPTMAIELVEISRNDCILYDEIVAHRLGLIPLTTDLASYRLPSDEEKQNQEYLAQSSVQLTLDVKGPCVVLAKDLKSKDPKIKPVYPDMPIAKLLEGQEIKLVATAVLGTGKEHTKWSPCHAYYKAVDENPESKTHDYEFVVESWGQLSPDTIVETAIETFNSQLKEFESLMK